jgi:glycosyltransferase involved in cell wall biosynthesis
MRVLILSQWYYPEPVPKPQELAEALAEKGHSVSVITGYPNYPEGKLYEGWKIKFRQHETINDIPVTRTYEYPYHGKNPLKRMFNYISFMLSAPFGLIGTKKFDVIYVWHPPLTVGVAAWVIARLRRVPFVYDVQDIWPDSVVMSGMMKEGFAVRLMRRLEKFVYKRADHIFVVTKGARENLIGKGVAPEKVTAMPHWIDENLFAQSDDETRGQIRNEYGWQDRFVVLFAGNIGIVQGLDAVVRAASLLDKEGKVLITLVGNGADKERLQNMVAELDLRERVQFIGWQPMEKMPAFMSAADALLVHLKRSDITEFVIPTKTMAYLAAGKPILMAMNGAAAQLVEESRAGIFIEPEEPEELAKAIIDFSQMSDEQRARMGENGRTYLVTNLSKEKVIAMYEEILERIASKSV